jgi:L-xylulokinase
MSDYFLGLYEKSMPNSLSIREKLTEVNKSVMMNSLYCIPGYYLIEESSPTSASNFDWFMDLFLAEEKIKAKELNINVLKYCDELAGKVAPGEQNIIFLPYIFGSNYNSQAKASLVGLAGHHTRPQIIRAVLEGIVFCHMIHLEKLLANRQKTNAVRLAGGAANSMIWAQIFADVFELPVEIIETKELGTLGCAMAAAVAAGVYQDLPEAAQHMVKVKCRIEPVTANIPVYEKKLALYKEVSAALEPVWRGF